MEMKWILFLVLTGIFVATAVVTLLGLIQKVQIREGYLKGLYIALILEVVGISVGLGKSADFFGDPLGDFLKRLPVQVQAESPDQVIRSIELVAARPSICENCDIEISSLLSEFPDELQRSTAQATIRTVNNEIVSASEVGEELEACLSEKGSDGLDERGLLPKLMVLHSDIQRFGNINFTWRAEEKNGVAFRVLEVLGELGHFQGSAAPAPSVAHEEVKKYQEMKRIHPANGRFGKKTFLQLFNDLINLE